MKYRHLIFDFDGVLVESNTIRIEGFQLLFRNYQEDKVRLFVQYAESNGGLSRYEKIRYFFEKILNRPISDDKVQILVKQYSGLVKHKVIDAKSVNGSLEFLSSYCSEYNFAIVSGSDQEELRDICRARGISHFFAELLGSPTSKEENLISLMIKMGWERESCLYIGDSINDLNAAKTNRIDFIGRNSGLVNWSLIDDNVTVVNDLSQLRLHLG